MRKSGKPLRRASARPPSNPTTTATIFELEVIPGLAEFAQSELLKLTCDAARLLPSEREDRVRFLYSGDPGRLLQLRQAVAVYRVSHLKIPRPKALLGHQHFEALIRMIDGALMLHDAGSFQTFHISAAGSDSSVFARIKSGIEARTGLEHSDKSGDLLLAVRRPRTGRADSEDERVGWDVAVRLSARPLSTRTWRVCDLPGALNATVASVMMSLTQFWGDDHVVNLACGSGTLLIERLALGPTGESVGCDISEDTLACARANLRASGYADKVALVRCDAGQVPLPKGWATTVCVDLPFGMLVGSHEKNEALYPRLLAEAERLTTAKSMLVAITQELRLFERTVAAQKKTWEMTRVIPIKLPAGPRASYIYPGIYLLNRR